MRRQQMRERKDKSIRKAYGNSVLPKVYFCSLKESSDASLLPIQYIAYLSASKLFPHVELFEMPIMTDELYKNVYDSYELSKILGLNTKLIFSRQIKLEGFNEKSLLRIREMALKHYFSLLDDFAHITLSSMILNEYHTHPYFKAHSKLIKTQKKSKECRLVPIFYGKTMRLVSFSKQEFLTHEIL
jgi:hypothetical protein